MTWKSAASLIPSLATVVMGLMRAESLPAAAG
jgi:hypothetical protein